MQSRRTRALWSSSSPAITPTSRSPVGQLTYEEALAEILNLKRLLSAERRTNQRAQRALCEHLDLIQTTLDNVRSLYVASIAMKPAPKPQGGKQ